MKLRFLIFPPLILCGLLGGIHLGLVFLMNLFCIPNKEHEARSMLGAISLAQISYHREYKRFASELELLEYNEAINLLCLHY
ncbi:MAG: hypothetical protein AB4058_14850 [Microcystaceae cyanobacterium]